MSTLHPASITPEAALLALSTRIGETLTLDSDVDAPPARRFFVTYADGSLVCEGTSAADAVSQALELL